jgi:hypothetical protein
MSIFASSSSTSLTFDQLRTRARQASAICIWHINQLVYCDPANPDVQSQLDYYRELLCQMEDFAYASIRPTKLPTFPTLLDPSFPTSPPLLQLPPLDDRIVTYNTATGAIIQVDWVYD